jgi:hypothetical protein
MSTPAARSGRAATATIKKLRCGTDCLICGLDEVDTDDRLGSRADDDALSRASPAVPWKADIPRRTCKSQEKRTTRKRLRYIDKTHFSTPEADWREMIGFIAARATEPADVPA